MSTLAHTTATPVTESSDSIDFKRLFNTLLRRKWTIVLIMAASFAMAAVFLMVKTPQYTAGTILQLYAPEQELAGSVSSGMQPKDDSGIINSTIKAIGSRTVAKRVIEKLNLLEDPVFNPKDSNGLTSFLRREEKDVPANDEITMIRAVDKLLKAMELKMTPRSFTVEILYSSPSAKQAQLIANTIAEEYLNFQIEGRLEASQRNTEWLTQNVESLRKKVIASENAVQDFREQHDLLEIQGQTTSDQQTSELYAQLASARDDHTAAMARLERARQLRYSNRGFESMPEVLASGLIQTLRAQESDLLRIRSDLANRYGTRHPEMIKVEGELQELRSKIRSEINNIIRGLQNIVDIAAKRIKAIEKQLDDISNARGKDKRLMVKLDDLQREAEADRKLYETMLANMKYTSEAGNMRLISAKIISPADLPLSPSNPKPLLVFTLFLFLGGMVGVLAAIVLEYTNSGFESPKEVEDALGVPALSMIPEVDRDEILADMAPGNTSSVYMHSLRKIIAAINMPKKDDKAYTFMVISSVPQEGKGWISSSLARMISRLGKNVLLLDCDFHRPLTLHPENDRPLRTLNEYLSGDVDVKNIIASDALSNVHYIGSIPEHNNVVDRLSSSKMETLVEYAKKHYDVVIIDSPPVIGLSDVLFLSRFADHALFVIRWLKTPQKIAQNALRIFRQTGVPVMGAVLSRVSFSHYRKIEFGKKELHDSYNIYYNQR